MQRITWLTELCRDMVWKYMLVSASCLSFTRLGLLNALFLLWRDNTRTASESAEPNENVGRVGKEIAHSELSCLRASVHMNWAQKGVRV